MIITLTDIETGSQFRYPALHAPSQWTVETMRTLGLVMTCERVQ